MYLKLPVLPQEGHVNISHPAELLFPRRQCLRRGVLLDRKIWIHSMGWEGETTQGEGETT